MVVVVVVVVFGRISTLVSLATLAEANQTDEKRRKKREADVCPQNARNQVRYTLCMMQCIYTLPFSIVVHASRLKDVAIGNILILQY